MITCENSVEATVRQQASSVDGWISTPKAAEIAGVHRITLTRWCERLGPEFAVRIGRNWRIRRSALARLLEFGALNDNTTVSKD